MEISGGCLCGAVRYRSTEAPKSSRICWCRLCQYLSAGGSTVNVVFAKDAVTVTGEVRDYACTADSGTRMHRGFCPKCGTQLFSEAESRPHLLIIRAGTFDDPELAKPSSIIWTAAAPSWACFDPKLSQIPGQPPPPPGP